MAPTVRKVVRQAGADVVENNSGIASGTPQLEFNHLEKSTGLSHSSLENASRFPHAAPPDGNGFFLLLGRKPSLRSDDLTLGGRRWSSDGLTALTEVR